MKKLLTAVVAIAAGLATFAPTVANADSYVRHDAVKDVVAFDETEEQTAAPDRSEGDIVTSGASHRPRKLRLAMGFASLTHASEFSGYLFTVRTNERKLRTVMVFAGPGMWNGQASMMSRHGRVKCRGLATRIDYTAHRMSVTIPRRCLSAPRWVQVGMAAVTGQDEKSYVDDALSKGTLGNNLVWGPRVRKG